MKKFARWRRPILSALLFAVLVLVLLWFQGIFLRKEGSTSEVPGAPALSSTARTARVERRILSGVQVFPGFVEAVDPAAVAPRVMAAVLSVAGREGDPVEEGAVVVVLDDREPRAKLSQAQAGQDAAQAQALQAQLAFDRAQRLHDADALTTQEWESARAARDNARAQEERARKTVEEAATALTWFQLTAPFRGRILERHADPGDLAIPGQTIVSLYREDQLRFRVAVPEERAAELSVGNDLEIAFDRLPSRRAKLTRILPPADPRTGTVVLHFALPSSSDLRPGLLGRLGLELGKREALVVPAAAVQHIGQVERVRLVRDGKVLPVTVRTGKEHQDEVEILSGLASGEEVVLP